MLRLSDSVNFLYSEKAMKPVDKTDILCTGGDTCQHFGKGTESLAGLTKFSV